MAIYYSILTWKIPWAEEPSGLLRNGLPSLKWIAFSEMDAGGHQIFRVFGAH